MKILANFKIKNIVFSFYILPDEWPRFVCTFILKLCNNSEKSENCTHLFKYIYTLYGIYFLQIF